MRRGRILVVEGEASAGLALARRLQAMGHEVAGVASSGEQAVELAERHAPDLVLMDFVLPGRIDGARAAAILHERFGIPSLFLGDDEDGRAIERAQSANPYGYLIKPYDERLLHLTLQSALYRRLAEREHQHTENERAQAAQEATARLAASVVHDVNNLLSSIRCNAFLIQSHPDAPHDALEAVNDIMTAVERGARSMSELVVLAREAPAAKLSVELAELSENTARLDPNRLATAASTKAARAKPPATAQAASQSAPTVLLVDDDPVVRRAVARFLKTWGYRVLEAGAPAAALELLANERIDLLITDLIMPEMTGYELHERVLEAQPDVRVVYMSGYAPDALTARCKELSGSSPAFLQKPFAIDALKQVVVTSLDASAAR